MPVRTHDSAEVRVGRLVLRPGTCEVVDRGLVQIVEPQVMRVLAVLASAPGRVVSRQDLVDRCWDGRAVSEDAINRIISHIRKLASESGAFTLRTVRKVGYRLEPAEAGAAATDAPPAPQRRMRPRGGWVLAMVAVVASVAVAILVLNLAGRHPPPAGTATLALLPMAAISAEDQALARRLDGALQASLPRLRGLQLQAPGAGRTARSTDLVLSGRVSGGPEAGRASLAVTDARTGAVLWSSEFSPNGQSSPTEERATAAALSYLAVWLGERADSRPPARRPSDPEAVRLVQDTRRALADARRHRSRNDWKAFEAAVAEANSLARRAQAADPDAIEVIKLGYDLESWPQYPRLDEDPAAFEARMNRARRHLARALATDPDDPEVLVAAANDYTRAFEWDAAERMYRRAIALAPEAAQPRIWYAYLLAVEGRCGEGLAQARAGAARGETVWDQQASPRLLQCDGQRAAAREVYWRLLKAEPANISLLRDLYLADMAWRDAPALRKLSAHVRDGLWTGRPPPEVVAALERIDLAAAALEGRPEGLRALLDREARNATHEVRWRGSAHKAPGDGKFVLGLELATAGLPDEAVAALRSGVNARSLYLPYMLPCGPAELDPQIRSSAAYKAIWRSHPQLVDLVARRREATPGCAG